MLRLIFLTVLYGMLTLVGTRVNASTSELSSVTNLDGFFAKLEAGQAVTVVAIGGSITMQPGGWAEKTVGLMRQNYPDASITFVNAGIAGTGSNFGVFRLKRDVLNYHPDLVFVEFAVNDGGVLDDTCVRNLESIVGKLQSLPSPPTIVFVESAARPGVVQYRHNRVAEHYGIAEVDLQAAVGEEIAQTGKRWDDLFKDDVHPIGAGHVLYAEAVWQAMQEHRLNTDERPRIPNRLLSDEEKGLILDGTLVVPNLQVDGWAYKEETESGWWRKYVQGSLQNERGSGALHIPFFGRTFGAMLLTHQGAGSLRLAVDGEYMADVPAFRPDWYYNIYVHPDLLDEGWHTMSLIPIGEGNVDANVHIAYLLLEDPANAPNVPPGFWKSTWPDSIRKAVGLEKWNWMDIPASAWKVLGPFHSEDDDLWEHPIAALNRDYVITISDIGVGHQAFESRTGKKLDWREGRGDSAWVDLQQLFEQSNQGVAIASTHISTESAGQYSFRLYVDYYAYVYVNGDLVSRIVSNHGSPKKAIPLQLSLKKGVNHLMIKSCSGSQGFGFGMEVLGDEAHLSVL